MEAPPKRILVRMDAPPPKSGTGAIAVFGGGPVEPRTGVIEGVGAETATDLAPGLRVMLGTVRTAALRDEAGAVFRIVKDSDIVGTQV